MVVAAGNDGRNNSAKTNGYGTIMAPGNDPYVITVGAMKDMGTPGRSDDLMAREKMRWVKAYKAWNSARDGTERAGIEQQMAFAAQDVAGRWRKDIEGKFTILKSLLDTKQLEEVRKLGKRAPASFE